MRHGRRTIPSLLKHSTSKLSNLLLVASVSKSLAVSGTRSLDPLAVPVTESLVLHILHRARLHPSKKVEFFKWASTRPSYKHSPCAYSQMFRTVCRAGRLEEVFPLLRLMKDDGVVVDSATFKLLLDAFIHSDGLFKARRLTEACQLFEKMVQDGVRASCWSYNILIDGLFRNGRAAAGYVLFCDLKKKGQFVDAITYSIVIFHLCKERKLEAAIELVEEMEGRGFVVDLVTITSVLVAFHREGRWDWAERLMKHLRDSSLVPNVLKWKADLDASLRAPQDRRKDFMPLFPSEGGLSDIMHLIDSTASSARTDEHGSHCGAQDQENSYSGWSLSPYVDQLANEAQSFSHSQLFSASRGMRVQELGAKSFNIDMVNTYMSIFLAKGKLSIACKLFEIFTEMGSEPVNYTYNSLMSSFVKKGYFKEAWGVLHEMGEKLCPADIATYNVIIQGLGKMGKADLASTVLDQLLKKGGYLDIVMYNTLINALGKAGRVDEANKLLKQMTESGINPDVVTFNTFIEVHTKAGRVKEAYKFLKMMLDAGCSPNHVTDTILDLLEKEIEQLRYQKASIKRNM